MRCDRSVTCGVCTAQLDYYSTVSELLTRWSASDFEAPGYVIDGPDGRPLRVCGFSCELELITGKSYRISSDQTIDIRGRIIVGA